MPGRFAGPVGKQFSGDRQAAMDLQGRARILVQSLFDSINAPPFNGKGSMHRDWRMPDGTVIHAYVQTLGAAPIVRTWIESPEFSTIEIDLPINLSLTMESGIIYLPTSPSSIAGTLKPLTEQIALNGSTPAFLDKIFTHRDYSAGAMDSLALPLVDDLSPATNRQQNLRLGQIVHARTNGKLKQLLQAKIAGYSRSEYAKYAGAKGGEFDSDLTRFIVNRLYASVEDFSAVLNESAQMSMFLYTQSLGNYYLVWINGTSVNARAVKQSPNCAGTIETVRGLIDRYGYAQGSKEYQRLESYALCACDFDGTTYTIGSTEAVDGQAIYYGWHASWDGATVAIVTHNRERTDGIRSSLYVGQVVETGSDEGAPLAFSVTERQSSIWAPPNISNPAIWYPFGRGGVYSQLWFPFPCRRNTKMVTQGTNVPIYCFFDAENTLRLVRVSVDPAETAEQLEDLRPQMSGTLASGGSGYAERHLNHGAVTAELVSVLTAPGQKQYAGAIGGFDSSVFGGRSFGFESMEFSLTIGEGTPDGTGQCVRKDYCPGLVGPIQSEWAVGAPQCSGRAPSESAFIRAQRHTSEVFVQHVVNDGLVRRVAIVIPEGNPSAVYIGELQQTQKLVSTQHQQGDGIYSWTDGGVVNKLQWNIWDWQGGSGSGMVIGPPINLPDHGNVDEGTASIRLVYTDQFGSEELPGYEESGVKSSELSIPSSTLFYPQACPPASYPYIARYFISVTSLEGPKFYQADPIHQAAITTNFEEPSWPNTAWFGSVFAGWQ